MSLNCNKCGGVKTLQKRKYVNKGVVNVYEYYYCNACIAEKARNVRKGIKFLKVKTAALVERKRILKPADELNLNIKEFVCDVERKRLYVDVVDCYKLISLFVDRFGIQYPNLSTEDELVWMWEKLRESV